jgi:microtubule-associated protein-like 6
MELITLPRTHRRGIVVLAFSPDGKHLVSVGDDDNHSVAVWKTPSGHWSDAVRVSFQKGDRAKTLFACFTNGGDFHVMTGGVKFAKFWNISNNVTSKKGLFGRKGKIQPLLCGEAFRDHVATGAYDGSIYLWGGRKVAEVVKAHTRSVNALFVSECGTKLVSGGNDGVIKMWSKHLECLFEYNMADAAPAPYRSSIRSVCLNPAANMVLVGTRGSEIYEVSVSRRRTTLLAEAHCRDELWGLAMHPTDPTLAATAGDDKTIRVWNLASHCMTGKVVTDCFSRSVAWSPDGALLLAGLGGRVGRGRQANDGAYIVADAASLEVVHSARDSKQWISDVKFSPDGSMYGIGSHDNKVYIYSVDGFSKKCVLDKHNSYITHFDFSADGKYVQSNCGAYELLFYSTETGEQETSATELRDVDWATWTCTLGWPVQGIWPAEADGTDINAVDRSHSGALIATADDFGKVKVFNYPCLEKGSGCVEGVGHSSHVTNVRFSVDDGYMLTTGGNDRSVFQWRVRK